MLRSMVIAVLLSLAGTANAAPTDSTDARLDRIVSSLDRVEPKVRKRAVVSGVKSERRSDSKLKAPNRNGSQGQKQVRSSL